MLSSDNSIEIGKTEIKNTLAVFEHVKCKEKPSISKVQNLKRLKRALSPTSDPDLVIDDDDDCVVPQKKRSKGVRLVEEPLKLTCAWGACQDVFENYNHYMEHIDAHIQDVEEGDEQNFLCEWNNCNVLLPSYALLKQHLAYHGYHTKLRNIGSNVLERVKLPKCTQMCDFMIPLSLDGYSCDWVECRAQFFTIYEFLEHIRLHVNSNPKYCKRGEIIHCYWRCCNFKCNSQYKLSDHLRTHTREKTVACPTCGNMFATKTKFYDHRKRQLPIEMQSFQCSQCSKLFPSERLLRDHMRSHINHYKCTMCDMTCPKPSALAIHVRYRHLKERPLKCNLCEHSCVSRQALETHLMTHCSEKMFACEECPFRCRSLNGLDKHYQIAHGQGWIQTYECHCCQKEFARGNLLTKHLIKEHNFHWPSGHSRFRYKEDTDGRFRLQTVRYESIEVTQEMMRTTTQNTHSEPTKSTKKEKVVADKPARNYVLMVAEDGQKNVVCPTENNILITINDVDEKGYVVSSEILQSNEMEVMNTVKPESKFDITIKIKTDA